jgi:glycerophosphoryl diester phosphodiesterase
MRFAHRCCSGRWQNTLRGARRALDAGWTALEVDLALTRDGQLVCSHEPWLSTDHAVDAHGARPPGRLRIREMSIQQLDAWRVGAPGPDDPDDADCVPLTTLPELLTVGAETLYLDLKLERRDRPQAWVEALTRDLPRDTAHWLEAPDRRSARALARAFPDATVVLSTPRFHADRPDALDFVTGWLRDRAGHGDVVQSARAAGVRHVACPRQLISPDLLRRTHTAGIQVVVYGLSDAKRYARFGHVHPMVDL